MNQATADILKKHESASPPVEISNFEPSYQSLVEKFLLSQDVKPNSRETYRRGLRRFISWITQDNPGNPTREDILRYKAFLESQSISPLTISIYLVTVRKFFEWTEGMKIYPNIAKGIKGARRPRGFHKDTLTTNQVKELLAHIECSNAEGKRDYAVLNLLIRTGLRAIETIRANLDDVRQESGEAVLWIQGKGRDAKDDFVLLTEDALKPIQEYIQERGKTQGSDPLFASLSDRNKGKRLSTRSVSRIAKKHFKTVGLESSRITAHSLRHTAITFSLLGGATIQEAQLLGRHTDINTTLIYAHNLNRVTHAPERKIDQLLHDLVAP